MGNETIPAIVGYTDDPYQQLAMAFGSRLEGGWSAPFPVGDQGSSFGPYQIHLPAHPGVSAAEASDPSWATSFMGNAYAAGVRAAGNLWSSDPAAAADKAAVTAERPAQDYIVSRGKPTVDSAFAAALNAIPQTSAAAIVQAGGGGDPGSLSGIQAGGSANVGGHWWDFLNPAHDAQVAADAAGNAIGSAFSSLWNDVKPFVVSMGFAGLGLALVGAGLVISTRGSRSSSTTTLPAFPTPSGGAGAAASELGPAAALA